MHNKLRTILQNSYCLSYDKFCEFYGEDNYYTKEKWTKFNHNFSAWYCDLDSRNAKRFIDFILGDEK